MQGLFSGNFRFGAAFSLGTNGYVKLPTWLGGVTFQWGTNADAINNVTHTITFPVAFSTACVFVVTRYDRRGGQLGADTGSAAMGYDHVSAMTTTNFQTPYTCPKVWFAVGY
jgi:hypothetical protein